MSNKRIYVYGDNNARYKLEVKSKHYNPPKNRVIYCSEFMFIQELRDLLHHLEGEFDKKEESRVLDDDEDYKVAEI